MKEVRIESGIGCIVFLIVAIFTFGLFVGAVTWESVLESPDYYEVEMNVSAYCTCAKCCGEFADGYTASGKLAEGLIIAAPPKYPFGTIMDVPGYGVAVVEDRGGAIKGNKLDILFPSHQAALNWGRKYLMVKVYKKGK